MTSLQYNTSIPSQTMTHREYVTTSPTTTGYVVQPHTTYVVEPQVSYVQEPRTTVEYVPQVTYVPQQRTTYETVPYTTYETKAYTTYDVQPIRQQQTLLVEQQVPVYYYGATEHKIYQAPQCVNPGYSALWQQQSISNAPMQLVAPYYTATQSLPIMPYNVTSSSNVSQSLFRTKNAGSAKAKVQLPHSNTTQTTAYGHSAAQNDISYNRALQLVPPIGVLI